MSTDNPLDQPSPFAADAPPIPLEGIPQGQTPMGNLGGLAMKVAPFFMGPGGALGDFGITPLMATMNAMGVTNPLLLSAIMKNAPGPGFDGEEAGSGLEGFGSLRGAAAGQMYQDPYNFAIAPPEDY